MNKFMLADLDKVTKTGLKVFSTFACGGGSSIGYKLAGYDVIGANDIDPEMKWHYETNLHPKLYYLCPIKDLITMDLPDGLFHLDILDGSPPCSTFSTSGNREKDWGVEKHFREGQAKQVLDDLFFDFIALAKRLQPKVVIAENVTGIIKGNAKYYAKQITEKLTEAGYRVQVFQINAANCGVAQSRERIFFIGLRNDIDLPSLALNPKQPIVTVWDAISDIQDLTDDEIRDTKPNNTDLKYWPKTKPGRYYGDAHLKGSFFSHYRLSKDKPANTLPANHRVITHPEVCRTMTFREFKRLFSFPDDYIAKTDNLGKYLCGMSVPPLMMFEVAKAVKEQWLNRVSTLVKQRVSDQITGEALPSPDLGSHA